MASDCEIALPGFQEFLERDVDRAGAVDFRKKNYNAIRIRADYPGTYESVARALFFYKLPVKTCADLFKMNSLCVAAIRDQVIAESATSSAASFLVNSRRRSQREIVLTRIVEAIAEKLDDEEIVKKMSIAELTDILNRLDKAPPARNGTDEPPKAKVSDGEIIDIEAYDQALAEVSGNRLDSAKKTARTAPEPSTEDAGNCSTGNSLKHCYSVSLRINREHKHYSTIAKRSQPQMQNILIRHLKELQGDLSVTAFAKVLEMPQNTLDCYIKERRKPSVDFILRICAKCGVSADWLLGLTDARVCKVCAERPNVVAHSPKMPEPTNAELLSEIRRLAIRVESLEHTSSFSSCG